MVFLDWFIINKLFKVGWINLIYVLIDVGIMCIEYIIVCLVEDDYYLILVGVWIDYDVDFLCKFVEEMEGEFGQVIIQDIIM